MMPAGISWGGGLLGLGGQPANNGNLLGLGQPRQPGGILDFLKSPATGDALQGLSAALLAYGAGSPNWGIAATQAMQDSRLTRGERERLRKIEERDSKLFGLKVEEAERTKNQDIARQQAWQTMFPSGAETSLGLRQNRGGIMSTSPEAGWSIPDKTNGTPRTPQMALAGNNQMIKQGGQTQPGPLAGMKLSPEQLQLLQLMGPEQGMSILAQHAFDTPSSGPASVQEYEYAKSQGFQGSLLDFERTKAEMNRAPTQPPAPPERVRLAQAAGLKPGTPEYQRFLLGDSTSGGPDLGNSFDAKAIQFLTQGNPADPMYAAVYNQMAQPRQQFDPSTGQLVTMRPDMSAYRLPSANQGGQPGQPIPGQQPLARFSDAGFASQQPQALPPQGQGLPRPAGVSIDQVGQPRPDKERLQKLDNGRAAAKTLVKALNDFNAAYRTAKPGERAESIAGFGTSLNTKYNSAALLAKGEELFNLGVLNGPDLDIIRRTITDPSTFASLGTDGREVNDQVQTVIDLIATRLNEQERLAGQPLTDFGNPKPVSSKAEYDALPSGTPYIAPDGSKRKKP